MKSLTLFFFLINYKARTAPHILPEISCDLSQKMVIARTPKVLEKVEVTQMKERGGNRMKEERQRVRKVSEYMVVQITIAAI